MTFEEARKIYNNWQKYIEIGDKLSKIFTTVPESFLPYSADTLEEALNIVAKYYFESGNKRMANNIQETLALHTAGLYMSISNGKLVTTKKELTDKEVLGKMKENLDQMFEHPDLLEAKLESLKITRDSWADLKLKQDEK